LPAAKREFVVRREPLKQGGFTQRNGAVLYGVDETALRRVVASARDGGGRIAPGHAAVDVLEAGRPLVAIEFLLDGECRSAAAILRNRFDQLDHAASAMLRQVMERVAGRPRGLQVSDRGPPGQPLGNGGRERDVLPQGG